MGIKAKINEDGKVELTDDGHPVYVDEESGEDVNIDVPALYSKVGDLNGEAAKYRKQRNEARETAEGVTKVFEGVEDLTQYKTDADKAMETVKNLKDKELVAAGKVEQIKTEVIAAKDEEIKGIKTNLNTALEEANNTIAAKDQQIHDLTIGAAFRQSYWFVGTNGQPSKTTLEPEIAESYFGGSFKVEANKEGKPVVVGYDKFGEQIFSRSKPGELADFDEAMGRLIDSYPKKDNIMRAGKSGSGAGEGQGGGSLVGIDAKIAKLEGALKEAHENKQGREAIAIKNALHTLRQQKQAEMSGRA